MSAAQIAWRMPRSVALERAAYTAAGGVLAIAPNVAPHGPLNVAVLAAGAGALAWCAYRIGTGADRIGRTLIRLTPALSALVVDAIAVHTGGWGWDALAAAGWTSASVLAAPVSRTRPRVLVAAPQLPPAAAQPVPVAAPVVVAPDPGADFTRGVKYMWEQAGRPGRTVIIKVDPHEGTAHDFTMLLRAAESGRAIGDLPETDIAAAFGVEPGDVDKRPVQRTHGRPGGPGWLEADVTPDARELRRKQPTDAQWWAARVGGEQGPLPGTTFTDKTRDRDRGVTFWMARIDGESAAPKIGLTALCKVMGASYDDGRVFVDIDGADVLVSVWDVSPLARVYPATREALTPDADGRWVTGYLTNGQPGRNRVHTDRGAAHGLFVAPSGGGKTQLMALGVIADANWGAVVWLATETPDSKTTALGEHIDRQGAGALYTWRALRAAAALMDIRAAMPWADGQPHDWTPDARQESPYEPLSLYLDEFLSAARHPDYGPYIMDLAEHVSVKGRKYAIGIKVAGQSVYVQDGFTQLLCDNLRANCIPVVLGLSQKRITETFKALGVTPEDTPAPLPRTFTPERGGRITRIINGEPEPAADSNTGGAGWIIERVRPETLRTLYVDFDKDIAPLCPETVSRLTAHETTGLEDQGLWGDWMRPETNEEKKARGVKVPLPRQDSGDDDGGEPDDGDDPEPEAPTSVSEALDLVKRLTRV